MKFFALFIYRPVATILLSVAITLCGILGFRMLPVAPLPQVDFPVIMVSASLPGASPETMASSVATPLERSLGRIAGVSEMTSSSSLGSTRIILQFDFDRDINFPIDVVLVTELADEEHEDEWVFPLEGDSADLDDIVRTVFVLNLDSKLLCKEDCKGLCHRCGKNLNDGPCNCQKELDPRFAALKQLLEK